MCLCYNCEVISLLHRVTWAAIYWDTLNRQCRFNKMAGRISASKEALLFLIVHFDADQCEKNEWTMWTPWEMGSTHVVKSGRWFLISQVITLNMPHAQKPCEIWFLLIHEGRAVEGLIAVSKGSSEHVWNAYIFDSYPGPSFSWEAVATVSSMLGWVLEWWAAPATWGSLLLALS